MQKSKLVFSATELQLASDTEWILTKNNIIGKVYILFGELSEALGQTFSLANDELSKVLNISPKISRGENYIGLPWVMLDYPRYFKDEPGIFSLRTFFWWGNYFLIQAQFSNDFIPIIVSSIEHKVIPTQIDGYKLYGGYPLQKWDNTLPQEGLHVLENINLEMERPELTTFKIAIKIPIEDYEKVINVSNTLAAQIVKVFLPG